MEARSVEVYVNRIDSLYVWSIFCEHEGGEKKDNGGNEPFKHRLPHMIRLVLIFLKTLPQY